MFSLIKTIKSKLVVSHLLLLSILLAGCASKVDEVKQQQLLTSFIERADIASDLASENELNWWRQFNSAELDELVQNALITNHDLKTSQLQLKSALARLGAQKAEYLPQGGFSISATRSGVDSVITRESSGTLGLDWQLDLFGRVTALVDAANASAMSQAEQLRLLKIEIVSGVVKGYINYQGNIQNQQIISKQITALKQSIDVLEARVEEGVASELDLNRTKAQLSQQQALLPDIIYAQYSNLAAIALLTGKLTKEISLSETQGLFDTPIEVAIADANNAIALRPDINQALLNFSQAYSLSVSASKALLPNISLSGFAGVLGLDNTRLVDTQQQWQVYPQIEWNLLSYPALLAQRDAQSFLSEAAYSEYQQVVLEAINESELSLQFLVKQSDMQKFAKARYKYANYAFLQAEVMYQEGQIPYLELLDARQDVLVAEKNNIDSAISSLIAKVSTYQAFNGSWSQKLATNEQ